MANPNRGITVTALIKRLQTFPPKSRVLWVDALGNNGYVWDATLGEDEGTVELEVIESDESFNHHSI